MTAVLTTIILLTCAAAHLVAYDNGYGDADMPTTLGGCANAIGCHFRNPTGTITLSTAADDGTWDTAGEPGTITATVNIDAVADDDSLPGVALVDGNLNIKTVGWSITSDPNSNPSPFNYNERNHVQGDEVFVWNVTAPNTPGTYSVIGRLLYAREWLNEDTVVIPVTTGVAGSARETGTSGIPGMSISPNPFSRSATITWSGPGSRAATLKIHDASGREVRNISKGRVATGLHTFEWDGRDELGHALPEGLYFLKLAAGEEVDVAKAILLR